MWNAYSAVGFPKMPPKHKHLNKSSSPLLNLEDSRLVELFRDCDKYLFSDFSQMKETLAQIKVILPPTDVVNQLTYLHYSGLFDNQYYQYESSYQKFSEGLALLDLLGTYKNKGEFLIDFIGTCMNCDELEQAADLISEVQQMLKEYPNPVLKAKLTYREGYLNYKTSQNTAAFGLLLDALQQFEDLTEISTKEYYFISIIHSGLGLIHDKEQNPSKSKESYIQAIDICTKHELKTRLVWYYLSAGSAFAMLEDTTEAISYFKKALQFTNDQNKNARAAAFANWGHCLFNMKLSDRALELYDKAEAVYLLDPENNSGNLARIQQWKGILYTQANDYANASGHFQKAFELAKKGNELVILANVSEASAKLYADNGHYKIAYEYLVQKSEYEEAIKEKSNSTIIRELSIKYSSEKKKKEIQFLEYQAKALQLRALRAQMNPHFLFNALNSIQNFIAHNNQDDASKYLSSFAKLIRKSLDYSELETISLTKEISFLEDYLYINKHLRFRDRLDYAIHVSPKLKDEYFEIPSMIVQPYVENAIEHGLRSLDAGMILVKFDLYDDDTIRCTISDNGVGRLNAAENKNKDPELQLHKSKGTQITLDRLSNLSSKHQREDLVRIDDNELSDNGNCGTKVTVLIPL